MPCWFLSVALNLYQQVQKQYHLPLSYSCGRFRLNPACQVSTTRVVSCMKAVPASSSISWLVISPGPCQIRNYLNPIILMHDTLEGAEWIALFAPQDFLFTHLHFYNAHIGCSRELEALEALPVLNCIASSSLVLSEEIHITGADQMMSNPFCDFAQQQHCGLKFSKLKHVHLLLWLGLFYRGSIHWSSFNHLPKLRPCVS